MVWPSCNFPIWFGPLVTFPYGLDLLPVDQLYTHCRTMYRRLIDIALYVTTCVLYHLLVLTWSKGKQNILSVFDRGGSRISESGYDYVNKYNILHAYVGAQQFLQFLESIKNGGPNPQDESYIHPCWGSHRI